MIATTAVLLALAASTNSYWLMGTEFITTERIDPVVTPGRVSSHVHSVVGGSNFRMTVSTASLRQSSCTSIPIPQDKSAYWFPHLYFQFMEEWNLFEFERRGRNMYAKNINDVLLREMLISPPDYLFSDRAGTTTAFPDDFRMISGDMTLRSYDPKNYAQQAVSHLCLDFSGVSTRHTGLPTRPCPSGIRSQINFPSCWDGKNLDSGDHKGHLAFPSGGPDSGSCNNPKFSKTVPRVFVEVYWDSNSFEKYRSQAKNSAQPFVFSNGDPTGYGFHADFVNGWDAGVLQKAVDNCHCNPYGDAKCCADQGIFELKTGRHCRITKSIDEATTGTLSKLPGNNPVVGEGKPAPVLADTATPALIAPVYAYTGDKPTAMGNVVSPAVTGTPARSEARPSETSSLPLSSLASSNAAATSHAPSPTPASASTIAGNPSSATAPGSQPTAIVQPRAVLLDSSDSFAAEQEQVEVLQPPEIPAESTVGEYGTSPMPKLTTRLTRKRRHAHNYHHKTHFMNF
ncbi:hypothetical protein FA15DRAFT_595516 [Coprinopsis marcescibilis]|uniref:DUF1996 domain-containing protein n=1 Tax=Coprinopsis marcescibilis TaxID=230819 RepID=A0A5C3KQD7_COPMA|nr:hypothetical protein FA15DRAFT_595516 [Coprinopsis marcescibilis]